MENSLRYLRKGFAIQVGVLLGQMPSASPICNILLLTSPEEGASLFLLWGQICVHLCLPCHMSLVLWICIAARQWRLRRGQEVGKPVSASSVHACDNCIQQLPRPPGGHHPVGPRSRAFFPVVISRGNVNFFHLKI